MLIKSDIKANLLKSRDAKPKGLRPPYSEAMTAGCRIFLTGVNRDTDASHPWFL